MKTGTKRTIGILLLVAGAMMMYSTPAQAGREKIVVGVATFADETGKRLGGPVTDAVVNTLVELKYFRVVERNRMDQLMKEVGHQQTGFVDSDTAVEIGRQLGASAMILGSVSAAGYNVVRNQWTDDDGVVHVNLTAKATVTLNVRIVSIETGEIVFAESITGNKNNTVPAGSQPMQEGALLGKAVANAAYNLYRPIQETFPLEGYIIKKDAEYVWVDFGSEWGIKKSRKVTIYREGEVIRHPKTGEILGSSRELVMKERVAEVQANMCKLKVKKKKIGAINVGDVVVAEPEGVFVR